jgi:hypothetical protein
MTFASSFGRVFSPTFQPKSQAVAGAAAWTPASIAGLVAWYDFSDANTLFTDAGSTKVSADGDLIYQANDKSGNNYHISQATSAQRPLYKTGIQNSLASMLIDDEVSRLTRANPALALGCTIISVATYGNANAGVGWCFGGNVNYSFRYLTFYSGTYLKHTDIRGTKAIWVVCPNTTTKIYRNGTLNASGNAGTNTGTYITVGGREAASGAQYISYHHEFIVYNTALSDTDRGTVETYLNNKWAIY